jgi:hypothetical protein
VTALPTLPSVQVLKNRGIPVLVHQVEPDPNGVQWHRVFTSDAPEADPVLETRFIKFTNLSLSDVEEKWGDTDEWEKALEAKPFHTMVATLAIMWECTRQEAGKRMIDDAIDDYSTAVGAAILMANGIEGDAVVRVLKSGVSSARQLRQRLQDEGMKLVMELEAADENPAADESATPISPNPETPPQSSPNDGSPQSEEWTSSGV